ncbi:hypothetical protein D9613_003621 [Agrocybe pediades]|uniref:Uncharacterized protein n=1 Tax=Agrocybe pediades TaxID=84607 RepID=A0A8H4QIT2_9AGAR|nr:hypothetical protein D9613_003621 [Agrocybe pediades]
MRFPITSLVVAATGVLGSVTTVTVTVTAPVIVSSASNVPNPLSTLSHVRPSGVPHTASSSIPIIPGGPVSVSSGLSSAIPTASASSGFSTVVLPSSLPITGTGIPPVSIPGTILSSISSAAVSIPSITPVVPTDSLSTSASATAPPASTSTQPSKGMKLTVGWGAAIAALAVPLLL